MEKRQKNKNKKRIIKVVHVLDKFPSKSETFIINLILETLEQNYSAQILANILSEIKVSSQQNLLEGSGLYENAKTFNPRVPENKFKRVFIALSLLFKNLKYISVFLRTLNSTKYGLKSRTLKMWFQASVFLNHRNASIFHAHFGINGRLLAEMKEIGAINGKIITSFYGYDTFSTLETQDYFRNYYSGAFKASNYIITNSNYLYNNLTRLNVPKDKVVLNSVGVNTKLFNYKKRNYTSVFKMITVGRLIKLKGQHIGLDVVKLLVDRGYIIEYAIVGSGAEFNNLQQKVKKLNLQNFVNLVGARTQSEIINLLSEHHVFLMTSITDDSGRAEGQGLVIAEAQATGMPIVGFNSGGVPETVKNGVSGFIVEEGDVIAMANAVEKFITNTDLINKIGFKARSFIEKEFNNKVQSQNIIDLYK